MAIDLGSAAVGAVVAAAALGALGYLARRYLFGEAARDHASLMSDYTNIAAALKEHGLTVEEVQAVEAAMKIKKRLRRAEELSPRAIDTTGPYWSQMELNDRSASAADLAEAQLEGIIGELRVLSDAREFDAFQRSQAKWADFRDAQVEFAGIEAEGGSMAPLLRNAERESIVRQRLGSVQALVEQRKETRG